MHAPPLSKIEANQYAGLLTKCETAELLGGVSVSFVNQLLGKKKLPKVRLSYRVTRIPRQAVEDYIRVHTTGQKGAV